MLAAKVLVLSIPSALAWSYELALSTSEVQALSMDCAGTAIDVVYSGLVDLVSRVGTTFIKETPTYQGSTYHNTKAFYNRFSMAISFNS